MITYTYIWRLCHRKMQNEKKKKYKKRQKGEGKKISKPPCVHIKHNVTMITHTRFTTAKLLKIRNKKYEILKDPMCEQKNTM